MALKFKQYIAEDLKNPAYVLLEEISANSKGVMHELLVGYHLNGGKHMEKHPDISGDSPKEAHDKLKSTMSKEEYHMVNKRAESAAKDIKTKLKGTIKSVQWTSKPGDIERSTGIKSSQKEDTSDIVVTTTHNKKPLHHGISLKVTDDRNKQVPVSNPGLAATHGGDDILHKHQAQLVKKFPALKTASNKEQRKAVMKSTPGMEEHVRKANAVVLNKVAKHVETKLKSMSPEQLVHHIKTHVLAANQTPMEKMGHVNFRHTTHGTTDVKFTTHHPSKDHEHIFNDAKNITVHSSGTGVVFKYKGKSFAKQRMKFTSQSDPLSTIKGSGSIEGKH